MWKWFGCVVAVAALGGSGSRASADACRPLECGLNGTWLGENIEFHELDSTVGIADHGIFITGFYERDPALAAGKACGTEPSAQGRPLTLKVTRDELTGKRSDGTVLKGKQLEGAQLFLRKPSGLGHSYRDFRITFCRAACTGYWDTNDRLLHDCQSGYETDTREVPVFRLVFVELTKQSAPRSTCGPTIGPNDQTRLDATSVIFTGDLYDAGHYTVQENLTTTKFNIACVGTVVAKVHLHRHTAAAHVSTQPDSHKPPVLERQALVKLLTADYCGIGRPFTHNGVPLDYTYNQPWQPVNPNWAPAADNSIDAIWADDGSGATCIEVPRLSRAEPDPVRAHVRDALIVYCTAKNHPIKACVDLSPHLTIHNVASGTVSWKSFGYAISANPTSTATAPSP